MKDPQEHVAAFEMVLNLYGQLAPIMAKLFATTLTGKAQEWFTNLPQGSIESYKQLVQKFNFHFASKKKQKRSATHLFNIRQREDETLKNFMGRFNNETLEVQELRIDMIVGILIHGLRKGPFTSALARDPPSDVEQLMALAQKYIDEEEMNAMKDFERSEHEQVTVRPYESRGGGSKQKPDKPREPKYQPEYHNYTPLAMSREKALMMVENADVLKWPRHTRYTPSKKFSNKYCRFHRERGHNTEECFQLKDEIERLVRQGYFRDRVPLNCKISKETRRSRSRSRDRNPGASRMEKAPPSGNDAPTKGVIYTIVGGSSSGDSSRTRKRCARTMSSGKEREFVLKVEEEEAISFDSSDRPKESRDMNDPIVVKLDIANFTIHKVLIDSGSSADIIFKNVIDKMGLENARLEPVRTPLVGFGGSEVASLGTVDLPVSMGEAPKRKTLMMKSLVVNTPFAYNVILGKPGLNLFRAVISTYHMKMKFPTENGTRELASDLREARKCYNLSLKGEPSRKKRKVKEDVEPRPYEAEHLKPSDEYKMVQLVPDEPDKTTRIEANMKDGEMAMIEFRR
ncbi:uncharacterized protein LOC105162327 [Sesamum indicum]|uniref:Uncharacterized protein LOC105162327 n=1 Tax=Sesamum indicum TaxID=4182 RepID=A0A6I9T4B7_SESIN|nr:uncharacterized protein LOC105162327 [Sesamum indicum]